MYKLLQHDPASAGGWNAVRNAPETIYRKQMFVEGLRASDKAFLRMLEDGEFVWREGIHTFRVVLAEGEENRVPARALDAWVSSLAGRYDSDLRPAAAVWKRLFGEELAKPKGARVTGDRQIFDADTDSEFDWQPFDFNTPMYHLPSLTTIWQKTTARTGSELAQAA